MCHVTLNQFCLLIRKIVKQLHDQKDFVSRTFVMVRKYVYVYLYVHPWISMYVLNLSLIENKICFVALTTKTQ